MYKSTIVAEKIKQLAKGKGISVKQLLIDCEMGKNSITHMTNGSMPKGDTLGKVSDYLDCSVDYLLGRTDDPVLHKPKEEIIAKVHTGPVPIKNIKTSSSQPDEEAETQQVIARQYFDMPASAGTGEWLGDDSSYSIINVPLTDESRRADFIIRVAGDSMEPKFYSGDKLLILKTQALDVGDIGVFVLNGESYVKKLGNSKLISINPAYADIPYDKNDTISVTGKVIGKVEE